MLATLNLQLTALELPDETLKNTAEQLPATGTEPRGGFADLLGLRVADAAAKSLVDGELLPPAGSELPLRDGGELPLPANLNPLPLLAEGASADDVTLELPETGLAVQLPSADIDIALEAQIPYRSEFDIQPLSKQAPLLPATVATAATIAASAARPTLSENGVDLLAEAPRVAEAPQQALKQALFAPPNPRDAMLPVAQRLDASADANTAMERAAINIAQAAAARTDTDRTVSTDTDAQRAAPLAPELLRRPELTASQRADAIASAVTQLVRPRAIVTEAVQTLQSQLNAQQGAVFQSSISTAAPTAVTETTYSAAAQQAATDLIGTPVRDPNWGERLSERVMMMAGSQLKSAEIRLTPAELGPLRVQVSVDDGATNVTFHAQHALTRDAIEQALPRLREMLAENGLSLANAQVGGEGVAEGKRDGDADTAFSGLAADDISDDAQADKRDMTRTRLTGSGLVDTFA